MRLVLVQALVYSLLCLLGACGGTPPLPQAGTGTDGENRTAVGTAEYSIGPGDSLTVNVWRHADLSLGVPVRPDGKISTPLVEDLQAAGKTPTELARDIEAVLSEYIKTPKVTVIVSGFRGQSDDEIKVIGQASQPRAVPYRQNMSLLDVLIAVGGLSEFAAPKRAKIVRRAGGVAEEINVRPDLILDGDMRYDVPLRPGDVLIIPEARF